MSRGNNEPEILSGVHDPGEHSNYSSVDDNPVAEKEVKQLVATNIIGTT